MSYDAVASLFLFFAASGPVPADHHLLRVADAVAPTSVAAEPMFAEIIARASSLKAQIAAYRDSVKANPAAPLAGFDGFKANIALLAAQDQAGSDELRKRGGDSDLKCILHGISQDLPKRLNELAVASGAGDRDKALREMSYLLNDNVEVITAPPAPPV